jgi:hypothetical protein
VLHWRKRIAEWRRVLAQKGVKVSVFALLRALLSGPVPGDVWRDRMRVCMRCPVYDRDLRACYKPLSDGRVVGCGCYCPFKALTAAPYARGCYAREITDNEGGMAYRFPSRWAKVRAIWRFVSA